MASYGTSGAARPDGAYSDKYLFIRSTDRVTGATPNAFTVKLPTTYRNVAGISLVSAEIPFSFYNVAGAFCYGINWIWTLGGTSVLYPMVIPAGYYAITDFQSVVLSTLKAQIPAATFMSCDYHPVSGKVSVTFTGGGTLTAQSTSGRLGQLIGCDPTGAVTSAVGGTLTFPACAQLFPFSSLLMCVDNLPASVLSTSSLHCFARVQVNAAPGGVIMVCAGTNVGNTVSYKMPIASLDSLAISLKNNDGTILDLNGVDWTATLMISSTD